MTDEFQITPATVTPDNAASQIERRMSDLVDLLAFFGDAKVDPRAWRQLLIYAPKPEINDAKAEGIAKILYAQHRSNNVLLPKWNDLVDFQRYAWTTRARAILIAAGNQP